MRHHPRFSRSRGADDGFFAGHDRPSLHELWHAFARRYERAGERGSERYEESFERRHGSRGDWHEFHGDAHGHGRHGHHGERNERRDRGDLGTSHFGRHGYDRFSFHAMWHAIGRGHEHRGGGTTHR